MIASTMTLVKSCRAVGGVIYSGRSACFVSSTGRLASYSHTT